jgi:hypothetical protein
VYEWKVPYGPIIGSSIPGLEQLSPGQARRPASPRRGGDRRDGVLPPIFKRTRLRAWIRNTFWF